MSKSSVSDENQNSPLPPLPKTFKQQLPALAAPHYLLTKQKSLSSTCTTTNLSSKSFSSIESPLSITKKRLRKSNSASKLSPTNNTACTINISTSSFDQKLELTSNIEHDIQITSHVQKILSKCILEAHQQQYYNKKSSQQNSNTNILFPGQDKFNMEKCNIFNHDGIKSPCFILQPKSSQDVSACLVGYNTGIQYLKTYHPDSKIYLPRLTIANGRNSHQAFVDGAITLDLSRMRSVKIQMKHLLIKLDAGARVQDLESACHKHGVMTISSTQSHHGVIGSLLHGGNVHFCSRKFGNMCQQLISADVVLYNGKKISCTAKKNPDIFWTLQNGTGGGIGVIVSITLKCIPLKHAALCSFDLMAFSKENVIIKWIKFLQNEVQPNHDLFSQLILPVNNSTTTSSRLFSNQISFFISSIDTQTSRLLSCDKKEISKLIPGLSTVQKTKFGAFMKTQMKFKVVKYSELHSIYTNLYYHEPGNYFTSIRYCRELTPEIIHVLVRALNCKQVKQTESRIILIYSNKIEITIEGRWTINHCNKKSQIIKWVHLCANQLSYCEGVTATTHPEAKRDVVSKSGKSKPPLGYYNFNKEDGVKVLDIQRELDPLGVFQLCGTRISYKNECDNEQDIEDDEYENESFDFNDTGSI